MFAGLRRQVTPSAEPFSQFVARQSIATLQQQKLMEQARGGTFTSAEEVDKANEEALRGAIAASLILNAAAKCVDVDPHENTRERDAEEAHDALLSELEKIGNLSTEIRAEPLRTAASILLKVREDFRLNCLAQLLSCSHDLPDQERASVVGALATRLKDIAPEKRPIALELATTEVRTLPTRLRDYCFVSLRSAAKDMEFLKSLAARVDHFYEDSFMQRDPMLQAADLMKFAGDVAMKRQTNMAFAFQALSDAVKRLPASLAGTVIKSLQRPQLPWRENDSSMESAYFEEEVSPHRGRRDCIELPQNLAGALFDGEGTVEDSDGYDSLDEDGSDLHTPRWSSDESGELQTPTWSSDECSADEGSTSYRSDVSRSPRANTTDDREESRRFERILSHHETTDFTGEFDSERIEEFKAAMLLFFDNVIETIKQQPPEFHHGNPDLLTHRAEDLADMDAEQKQASLGKLVDVAVLHPVYCTDHEFGKVIGELPPAARLAAIGKLAESARSLRTELRQTVHENLGKRLDSLDATMEGLDKVRSSMNRLARPHRVSAAPQKEKPAHRPYLAKILHPEKLSFDKIALTAARILGVK